MFLDASDSLSFLGVIHVPEEIKVSVAFFQAAFEGSGTIGQHAAISYAGVVTSTAQWSALTEPWTLILEKYQLKYFKMAEAMTWFGEFAGKYSEWGTNRVVKRDELLYELASVAIRYQFKPYGKFSDTRLLTEEKAAGRKMQLVRDAITVLIGAVPKDNFVTLIFDDEADIEPRVRGWIRTLRRQQGQVVAPVTGVCFVDERVIPGVQLADMIAWLVRERGERLIKTGDESLHPLLSMLAQDSIIGHELVEPNAT